MDLIALTQLTGLALGEEVIRRLHQRGHPDLRFAHGFVFQHVVHGPIAVGELARRMGVTQQAVSKSTAELERLGYLERTPDPQDARIRRIGLTERGRAAIETTRAIRAELEADLAEQLGTRTLATMKRALTVALDAAGGTEAVRTRRVPAPR